MPRQYKWIKGKGMKKLLLTITTLCFLVVSGCAKQEEDREEVESVFSTQIESLEKPKKVEGMLDDASQKMRDEIERQEQ